MQRFDIKKLPRWATYLSAAVLTAGLGVILFFVFVFSGFFGPVPGKAELADIRYQEAAEVYSSDGELLGTYYYQNRTGVSLNEVPPAFLNALQAIEDIRFYDHNGIDGRAMARVLVKTIFLGQETGGGSTLTQQLAKSLYPRERNGWFFLVADKFREMIIARRLESIYTKDEILELYLNSVSFGEEIFGLEMASRRFFEKQPGELELHEAATLAGMLKATSWYNPYKNPEQSLQRRNVVIRQMEKYDMISDAEADSAQNRDISTQYNRITASGGLAPYFREHVRGEATEILQTLPALDGENYNLYTDGLRIETTLDSRLQKSAEEAVYTHLKDLQSVLDQQIQNNPVFGENDPAVIRAWENSDQYKQLVADGYSGEEIEKILYQPKQTSLFSWEEQQQLNVSPYDSLRHYMSFLNSGFLAMDPVSGDVLAWVGGVNHHYYKYDHVKAKRQAGSAFKPIVYSAAIEAGQRPCDYHRNMLTTYDEYDAWTPRNSHDEYGGRYSLQAALAQSINTIAVDLVMETGIEEVRSTANKMGIHSEIPPEPSIALGTADISLLELTTSYTTFLNAGQPASPRVIKAIYNSDGDLIYDFSGTENTFGTVSGSADPVNEINMTMASSPAGTTPAISPQTASTMVHMLSKVVNEGTGSPLRTRFGIQHALAGKTGTTQNYTDGWFIGMTPELVFGAWVGADNPRVRFRGNMGYGSQTALPVVGYFLNNLQKNKELSPQPNYFYPEQIKNFYNFKCEDQRDDRFTDRLRDFFRGKDTYEPRVVEEKKESRNIFQRLGRLFSRDKNKD